MPLLRARRGAFPRLRQLRVHAAGRNDLPQPRSPRAAAAPVPSPVSRRVQLRADEQQIESRDRHTALESSERRRRDEHRRFASLLRSTVEAMIGHRPAPRLPMWQVHWHRHADRFGHGYRAAPAARLLRQHDAGLVPFQRRRDHQTTSPRVDRAPSELLSAPRRDSFGPALRWKCLAAADCLRELGTVVRRTAAARPVSVRARGTAKSYRPPDERKRKVCPALRARAEPVVSSASTPALPPQHAKTQNLRMRETPAPAAWQQGRPPCLLEKSSRAAPCARIVFRSEP